jgi:hypothetical protein
LPRPLTPSTCGTSVSITVRRCNFEGAEGLGTPDYLVPTRIYVINQLPMTTNGKLDHLALRGIKQYADRLPKEPPRTDLEQVIGEIAVQLLGVASVGLDEDFFDLGANSMLVLALTARLSERIGRPVPNHVVYSARTVRSLAGRIDAKAAPGDSQTAQRVRDRASRIRQRFSH